ncbi:MAG: hypothetical protein ACC663_09805, partial [Gammaproteobacteria bacterium]
SADVYGRRFVRAEHPRLDAVHLSSPPDEDWRKRCATAVLELLKSGRWDVHDYDPVNGPPTLEFDLGPDLASWGRGQGIDALVVGRCDAASFWY